MANTVSGNFNMNVTFVNSIGTGSSTNSSGVINSYSIPISGATNISYVSSTTSAALGVNKIATMAGSLTTSGTASYNLLTIPASDGSTAGFSHWRELIVFNDGATTFSSTSTDVVTIDLTTTSAMAVGVTYGPVSVTCALDVPNGSYLRLARPYGTTGWSITTAHSVLQLNGSTTNAATVNYRVIVVGD